MADQRFVERLIQGTHAWNTWRGTHSEVKVDLSEANLTHIDLGGADLRGATLIQADLGGATLSYADLGGADLRGATLIQADLSYANLIQADLREADLGGANLILARLREARLREADLSEADLGGANLGGATLSQADLSYARLRRADLRGADLRGANLGEANLGGANLSYANLSWSNLSEAILRDAKITGCRVYAISAWNVEVSNTTQTGLIITRDNEATITVDNLEVAQFIYLLLNSTKIRDVIDAKAKKAVLILGRFPPERKAVLDALKEALRVNGYLPILFDFEKPGSRDFTETVSTLAHLSRFLIADLTDPACIPHELYALIPQRSVPVQPLFHPTQTAQQPYAMFQDLRKYPWVLPSHHYTALEDLLASLQQKVIAPAEQKAQELEKH